MAAARRLSRRAFGALALTAAAARAEAAPELLPEPLATLQTELAGFRYCPDEVCEAGEDWWGFWWSLPERGCGDCEDFAAYSFARLEQLGVPHADLRVMAAEVGAQVLSDGSPAKLLHVWLEVDLAGDTWTVWNRQIRVGTARPGPLLSRAEIDELIDRSFGPNWPYGIEVE
mgnify:CR=1 FL=1